MAGTWFKSVAGLKFHFARRGERESLCRVDVSNSIEERAGVGEQIACSICSKSLARQRVVRPSSPYTHETTSEPFCGTETVARTVPLRADGQDEEVPA